MKLLPLFLAGFAAGLAVCWAYVSSLKATIKLYETYIHERIDALANHDQSHEEPAPASSYPQALRQQAANQRTIHPASR